MALTNSIQLKTLTIWIFFRVDSKSCTYINPHSERQTDRLTNGLTDGRTYRQTNMSYLTMVYNIYISKFNLMKLYSIENQLILIIFVCLFWGVGGGCWCGSWRVIFIWSSPFNTIKKTPFQRTKLTLTLAMFSNKIKFK